VTARDRQLAAREGRAGPCGVAERSVVVSKPGNSGGAKGPQFKVNARSGDSQEIGVSLIPPTTVGKLQETLHAKAKSAPTYRFYALYDKVYRADVLLHAYECCRLNGGTAGVDGQTFADIEAYGVGQWLGELAEELRKKTYRPQAVRRVYIPKPGGKQRPLGIPMIRAYCTPYQKPWGWSSCRLPGSSLVAVRCLPPHLPISLSGDARFGDRF
jgi:hypothetical protein